MHHHIVPLLIMSDSAEELAFALTGVVTATVAVMSMVPMPLLAPALRMLVGALLVPCIMTG